MSSLLLTSEEQTAIVDKWIVEYQAGKNPLHILTINAKAQHDKILLELKRINSHNKDLRDLIEKMEKE